MQHIVIYALLKLSSAKNFFSEIQHYERTVIWHFFNCHFLLSNVKFPFWGVLYTKSRRSLLYLDVATRLLKEMPKKHFCLYRTFGWYIKMTCSSAYFSPKNYIVLFRIAIFFLPREVENSVFSGAKFPLLC